jgi:hypothetical protein
VEPEHEHRHRNSEAETYASVYEPVGARGPTGGYQHGDRAIPSARRIGRSVAVGAGVLLAILVLSARYGAWLGVELTILVLVLILMLIEGVHVGQHLNWRQSDRPPYGKATAPRPSGNDAYRGAGRPPRASPPGSSPWPEGREAVPPVSRPTPDARRATMPESTPRTAPSNVSEPHTPLRHPLTGQLRGAHPAEVRSLLAPTGFVLLGGGLWRARWADRHDDPPAVGDRVLVQLDPHTQQLLAFADMR